MHRLLRLHTVKAVRRDRISSDEEERRRSGYELVTSYRFDDGDGARAEAVGPAGPVVELHYGDSATVRVTNLGLRRRRTGSDDGYWIDARTGHWLRDTVRPDDGAGSEDDLGGADGAVARQRVIPFVEDVRNVLVTRLCRGPVTEATAVSTMFALERGVEAEFQLEDGELTTELLPDADDRGRALFVESAEGGAGVLRRLVEEDGALRRAARRALEICHFDPDTGADRRVVDGTTDECVKACYDCLLSYGNQNLHLLVDRHAARDVLLDLARTTDVLRTGGADGSGWEEVTLATEADPPRARFVAWLEAGGYRCPDRVDTPDPETGARADLVYALSTGPVAVFVDGPDDGEAPGRDADAEDALRDLGWGVVRVPYGADYQQVVGRYPSVFGRGRNGGTG